jgi:hypothetical protein
MNEKTRVNRFYASATAAVLAGFAFISFGVWYFRPPLPDAQTLCPTTRPIAGHTLVIVDRTDRWNPAVGEALTELIEHAQRDTRRYEKFSIVALDANLSTRPVFSVCNPGEPNFLTDLYRGRRYTRLDFDQKFIGAADSVVSQLRAPAEAHTSPIVEYVHRWLGRDDFNAQVPHRRLVLISDMRQNSNLLSMYADPHGGRLGRLVQDEFGDDAGNVAFDVYFVAHGHDHNVPEIDVRDAWDVAFRQIAAQYQWRQLD